MDNGYSDWSRRDRHGYGPPGENWVGFGRVRRFMVAVLLLLFVVPVVLAAALTALFAGWTGAAAAAIISLAVLVAGVILARFMFRSFRIVKELVESTAQLADGDYTVRVSTGGPPAFAPISESFNNMAERLESSDDLRRRLLADVGHELRTPLTIVRGELEAMADGVRDLNETEIRRLLIDVAAMERLLDDLKTLSTTEAGMLTLHREPTDLATLVASVVDRYRAEAETYGATIFDHPADETIELDIDVHRISEVVLNLLTNAVRAVEAEGHVELRTFVDPDDNGWAAIDVVDDGVGLAPDQLEAVFDRFHRGPGSDGSGLGLTISRRLVEAHGGTISASSIDGQGTKVTVRLPVSGER